MDHDKTKEKALNHFQSVLGDKYKEYEFFFADDNGLLLINPVERREIDELGQDRLLEMAIDTLPHRCMVCMEHNVFT
ncbi:DEHA2E03036p [Debaryomyces hansenii CBS767]|jgi:hypothetical protein|uniref:DEHA2E03036p n=1 Tax=Debaryomyces hansenii (strain ATCC 36239 / CBS 767 / BCRC 21394 / JCM 1990 / NBRC 0083 / IGC 2968) TaxID=284592 RepID=Q6BQR0_DEBHA|nr:DEHA2E03036p [Debaryomyces hansenii CBS767]CAG87676.1 DEHA2E03036p [Debaryomyces hansenii CBS767]|eukprot:XP_459460.1 DEHA2E03036p [Debaryomyces hansenii CBS767]